jgi:16S rRNA (uracil1498-N3)-methyltransferase
MDGPEHRRMIRLFVAPEQIANDAARITGADHLHLARVLRARPGQSLVLLDNRGNAFKATLVAVNKAETVARIDGVADLPPEPLVRITVAQALGKGDKFEQVIQHSTEIGASAFVPLRAERSVVDIPAARVPERVARWRQIAKGAAEQSGRGSIPAVSVPVTPAEALAATSAGECVLLLHPSSVALSLAAALRQIDVSGELRRLTLAVGPEGGWSEAELTARNGAAPDGVQPLLVTLGPRILRTETAALVAISQILYHFEQLLF